MLLLIIFFLVCFSLISMFFYKYKIIFVFISILIVISFYLFLSTKFYHPEDFFPSKNLAYSHLCFNYYNILMDSLKSKKLHIANYNNSVNYKNDYFLTAEHNFKNSSNNKIYFTLLDTSYYKGKIYLYFGISPVLLFYLPLNLISNLYLTDKFLVFTLSCFIFLFSLFLTKKILEQITDINNIPSNIIILSIFIIGFCNLSPFLIIRSSIYEVAITTASFLALLSLCFLYYLMNIKTQFIFVFLISSFLCLAVGARPHYVLFIPIFLLFIIYLQYKETRNIKNIFKTIFVFFIPCIVYGTILALYNYLRFDSIFEFGFKYQINPYDFINFNFKISTTLNDFIITIKQVFFKLPNIDLKTIFSLAEASGHSFSNDYITGLLWTCPIVFTLIFTPVFFKQIYKNNINCFIFLLIITTMSIINIIVTSFFGIIIRYTFEYLFLMVILSIITFLFYISKIKDKSLKNFFNFLFILIFAFSIFINISLLFCKDFSQAYSSSKNSNYTKTINFLF